MESEAETLKTKISDSGYSNSCSNSNSQRSSKSRLSGSNSSGSSGYRADVNNSANGSSTGDLPKSTNNRIKDKEHKKKLKSTLSINSSSNINNVTINGGVPFSCTFSSPRNHTTDDSSDITMGVLSLPVHILEAQDATKQILETCNTTTTITDLTSNIPKIESSSLNEIRTSSPNEDEHEDDEGNVRAKTDTVEMINTFHDDHPIDTINEINPCQPEEGFCCVTSMYDGIILYTTSSLTKILGFPTDMWLGRSFTDFIHPKDREMFSAQVTSGVAIPLMDAMDKKRDAKSSLYVCLRKYKGLRASNCGVIEKAVSYQAFHLSVSFRHMTGCVIDSACLDNNRNMFLVIAAVPVYSSYTVPDEIQNSKKFGMRHTAACIFSHVDADVVMKFGYLPQDMLGKSVFDFYHPEDLPFLKEVYESVMNECQIAGTVYRSKPYRFAVRNGDFVMIETEWSCFINPWSRKLEFVLGLHRVLQGPTNPDVFESPKDDHSKYISEEVLKEAKIIREEILVLLNQELLRPSDVTKQEVSKRCKNLAIFMETIIDEVSKSNIKTDPFRSQDVSVSERDSVMLGEISPHHDYYDRESSSVTPPSYNQLNYNENIQRFFKSKQITTTSDESGDRPSAIQSTTDTDQERKSSSAVQTCNQKCPSTVENSGDSGSGSGGNLSSGSNPNMENGTASVTNIFNDSYTPSTLTQELLLRHNEDMEKIMRQRYREYRSNIKADREGKKSLQKSDKNNQVEKNLDKSDQQDTTQQHGLKRSGSRSSEGDKHKISKRKHQTTRKGECIKAARSNAVSTIPGVVTPAEVAPSGKHNCNDSNYASGTNDANLWPPFSVPSYDGTTRNTTKMENFPTGMFPVYYFPGMTPQQGQHFPYCGDTNGVAPQFQVQYMPGLMCNYNPMFPASPIFCPPMAMVPVPMPPPAVVLQDGQPMTGTGDGKMGSPNGNFGQKFQRPASIATSIKAEPGSAIGSVASVSVANRAMSECSRKDLGLSFVCSPDTLLVSPPDGERHQENSNITAQMPETPEQKSGTCHDEGSSYSSFYSSFLKTDTGSGSNDDFNGGENKNKSSDDVDGGTIYKKPPPYPIRKCDPPWLETVNVTPELMYRYQMRVRNLDDILESDMRSLKDVNQPFMVNDQLDQLYIEMELEGLSTRLTLEEGITSSSSSSTNGEEGTYIRSCPNKLRRKKKSRSYSSIMMIYEENAPFPPPDL